MKAAVDVDSHCRFSCRYNCQRRVTTTSTLCAIVACVSHCSTRLGGLSVSWKLFATDAGASNDSYTEVDNFQSFAFNGELFVVHSQQFSFYFARPISRLSNTRIVLFHRVHTYARSLISFFSSFLHFVYM